MIDMNASAVSLIRIFQLKHTRPADLLYGRSIGNRLLSASKLNPLGVDCIAAISARPTSAIFRDSPTNRVPNSSKERTTTDNKEPISYLPAGKLSPQKKLSSPR